MDTGHHFDLCQGVLQECGFGQTAIDAVKIGNWFTDYFAESPTSTQKADFEKLHFDNLFSTVSLANYWGHLLVNTRRAVQEAANEGDVLKFLTVFGISLHVVQDFYSHSNWAETHPRSTSAYRAETWFDLPPDSSTPALYTGSYPNLKPGAQELHGDYTSGLNKDSYVRPRWDEGYIFGYAASLQWVNAVKSWVAEVSSTFWTQAQAFSDANGLAKDLEAAYRISEWIAVAGADGHWKGNGSGSAAEFATFALAWTTAPDSQFVQAIKVRHLHRLISDGLSGNSPPASTPPSIAPSPIKRTAVIVRTLRVEETPTGIFEPGIDPAGKADFFARIKVAGQTFVEATQQNRAMITPSWTTIRFIPRSSASIEIRYELWDEDGGLGGADDQCDINPTAGRRHLEFQFDPASHACTGDIAGVHDSPTTAVRTSGSTPDSDRALVEFYIGAFPVGA